MVPFANLDRAAIMKCALGAKVRIACVFCCREMPNEQAPAINTNAGHKCSSHRFVDARKAAGVVRVKPALVLCVDVPVYVSQIGNAVVPDVAVDVIDMAARHRSCVPEPNKSVQSVFCAVDSRSKISVLIDGLDCLSDKIRPKFAGDAHPSISLWCVVKNFAQSLRGKIGLSHEAVLSLIGQGFAGVASAVRTSPFYRMAAR